MIPPWSLLSRVHIIYLVCTIPVPDKHHTACEDEFGAILHFTALHFFINTTRPKAKSIDFFQQLANPSLARQLYPPI